MSAGSKDPAYTADPAYMQTRPGLKDPAYTDRF